MKNYITYFIICILIFPVFFAVAEEAESLLRQSLIRTLDIKSDKDRLKTYDAIAKKVKSENELKVKLSSSDGWTVRTDIDPIDDSKIIIFSLYADEKIDGYSKPLLVLRNTKDGTEAFISWGKILPYSEDGTGEVILRFDKEEALTENWGLSKSHDASFSPEPYDLIKKILAHNSLVVRTSGVSYTLTTQFSLKGLKQLVEKYDNDLH
jgi:hypothetical protein